MKCIDCGHYNGTSCKKYKTAISNPGTETDCKKFLAQGTQEEKPKGVQIRDAKRANNNAKMRKTKPEQKNACRFIVIEYLVFKHVSGKLRPFENRTEVALQIGNKAYLNNGKYKFVNNKNLHIVRELKGIPRNINKDLVKLYHEHK